MTKLETIRAEIERRKSKLSKDALNAPIPTEEYYLEAEYNSLLSFLSTLESEKPMDQDGLEEEIKRVVTEYSEKIQGTRVMKPSGVEKIARHFAQWGKDQMMEGAVEGRVYDFRRIKEIGYSSAKIEFDKIPELDDGDKVRIIIVKEDEK